MDYDEIEVEDESLTEEEEAYVIFSENDDARHEALVSFGN